MFVLSAPVQTLRELVFAGYNAHQSHVFATSDDKEFLAFVGPSTFSVAHDLNVIVALGGLSSFTGQRKITSNIDFPVLLHLVDC